jgi:hypothetical protein
VLSSTRAPVRDQSVRRGETKTTAAAGHQVHPVLQAKIHEIAVERLTGGP